MNMKTVLTSLCLMVLPLVTLAQSSPFQAAVTVNGVGVTYFEIAQRARMLAVLGTIGDAPKLAREALIDDRLQQLAARQLGITLRQEDIQAGIEEFAKRVNLNSEQMIEEFVNAGVDEETFIDFVRAGIIWRAVVQQKFQAKAFVTEAELDAALSLGTTSVGASVLLSELVLQLPPGQEAQTMELAASIAKRLHTKADFDEAVLTYSASPTRDDSGNIDWLPIGNLPAEIGTLMLTRGPGMITPPVRLPNAVAIFRLRDLRDNRTAAARTIAYDYATYLIPGGHSAAAMAVAGTLASKIDTCKDLAAAVRKQPENLFHRELAAVGKVPRELSAELAQMDTNEISTRLTRGQNSDVLVFLMLCSRTTALASGNREEVRNALFAQRLEAFSQGYLQELRGDAIIIEK